MGKLDGAPITMVLKRAGRQYSPSSCLPAILTASTPGRPNAPSLIPLQQLSGSTTIASMTNTFLYKFNYPWKYDGYRSFCRFMASGDDFFIIRRFQDLNARTILWMQDRIVQFEEDLKRIDQMVEDADLSHNLRNDSFRWDRTWVPERHTRMEELSSLLHHYSRSIYL